ncbi:hypothetical protein AB0M48_07455 [Lentzea sp. NPDC051208]|uniref:lipopolysaccharide biosynthesis protein n=1 Tax=Lentzea sp. NPDC051208 TaxID=3154642 RepID=UPI00342463F6
MKTLGRSLGTVSAALLVGTALGTLLQIGSGRLLSTSDFAVFNGYWGVLFAFGAAVGPIEQEVSRLSAHAALRGERTGFAAVQTALAGGVVVALAGLLTLVPPIGDRLFSGHSVLGLVALAGGIGFAVQVTVRGLLIGHDHVRAYGGIVVVEAAARVLVVGGLLVAGLTDLVPMSVAVAVGSFAWLFFIFSAGKTVSTREGAEPWGPLVRRVVVLMFGAALTASVLTGYPAMVNLLTGDGANPALGALFATVIVARAPLLLLQPVQAMAVPLVVRLSQDESGANRLRALLVKGVAGAVVLGGLGAVVGWFIGPWLVRTVYGPGYVVTGWAVAGLAWSSVLLGATLLLAAVLVARKQAGLVLVVWAVVAGSSAATLLFWPGDTVTRAVLGLAIAPTIGAACACAFVLHRGVNAANQHG